MSFKLLDQTSDINGQQLYRLSRLYPLPTFVKQASSDAIYGENDMQNHQYADPTHRAFPCHTAAATYISTLFFLDKQAEFNPEDARFIESRLDDFAFFHGISQVVNKLKTKLASDIPRNDLDKLSDDSFALVLDASESPSGAIERHYPLRNALEVKKAAEWLRTYEQELPYKHRQKIATKVLCKAAEFGAGLGDLDEFLQKQGGVGTCAADDAAQFLFNRARLYKRAGKLDYAVQMGRLAKTVASRIGVLHDQDQRIKLAGLVDEADRESGLTRFVDDLQKPEDVFFAITEKTASKLREEHLTTTSGNIYKLADFDKLRLTDVRDMMGEDFADAVSAGGLFISPEKMAEIVPTLPRGDADLFDRLLSSIGINPVAKEAAHERGGFDTADLLALAGLHKSKDK